MIADFIIAIGIIFIFVGVRNGLQIWRGFAKVRGIQNRFWDFVGAYEAMAHFEITAAPGLLGEDPRLSRGARRAFLELEKSWKEKKDDLLDESGDIKDLEEVEGFLGSIEGDCERALSMDSSISSSINGLVSKSKAPARTASTPVSTVA